MFLRALVSRHRERKSSCNKMAAGLNQMVARQSKMAIKNHNTEHRVKTHINLAVVISSVQFSCSVLSNSVRPRIQKPTGFPRPWDSPGKNTGVGCHFLLQCMKVKSEREVAQSCPTLSDPMDCSLPGSSIRGIFQAKVLEWGAIAFSGKYSTLRHVYIR